VSTGGPVMPRILLVVDEFQEFFVEDDRVAQDAALLLDRLVRQGRAFGLHVLLGSQTLGGAYSLARSTIDQMAVRIALQCSEADAGLILSKDNNAARLLSRPGEAISIKQPTAAVFRRQSANNLLILGQQPDGARALVAAATVAAAAQGPAVSAEEPAPRVVLIDGTPADDPHTGYFARAMGE